MIDRRRIIAAASVGAAAPLAAARALAQPGGGEPAGAPRISALSVVYRTDAERIARVLPPPLRPADIPLVQIDFMVSSPPGGVPTVMAPDDYFETAIHVAARYGDHTGLYQLTLGLNGEWGRSSGREGPGWVKKEGLVRLEWGTDQVEAGYARRGRVLTALSARITEAPAHPRLWMREFGWGAFLFRHRLDPDWRRGLVDPEYGVELWRLGGNDLGFPTDMAGDEPGVPRALDPASIRLTFPELSVIDGWGEFPVREIIGGSFAAAGPDGRRPRRPMRQGSAQQTLYGQKAAFLAKVDAKAFEPFALFSYDRPTRANRPMTPPGWPARATSWRLTDAEQKAYRGRASVGLTGQAVIVDGALSAEIHRQTLPPMIEAGAEPLVRMMALQIASSDISTVAFNELWLMVRCRHEGRPAWYALSHIVGPGGDVLNGRENLGYPSKTGEVEVRTGDGAVGFSGRRLLREFARVEGRTGGAAALADETLPVVGIAARFNRPETDDPLRACFVIQPWRIAAGAGHTLSNLEIDLSDKPGPGRIGLPDPWFQLAPAMPRAWTGPVRVDRMPGAKGAPVNDYRAYYMERMDGTRSAAQEPSTSTFLINRPDGAIR